MPITLTLADGWNDRGNHVANGNNEAGIRGLALQGLEFLRTNQSSLKSRGGTVLGDNPFWRPLYTLSQALNGPNTVEASVLKGIHQFGRAGKPCMPHITVRVSYPAGRFHAGGNATAHFWLSIGKPLQYHQRDKPTMLTHYQNLPPPTGAQTARAYCVAQVSLSVEGPFFPGEIQVKVSDRNHKDMTMIHGWVPVKGKG